MKTANLNDTRDRNPGLCRNELLTIGDLETFKNVLLSELKTLLEESKSQPLKQWLRSSEIRKMLGVSSGTLQNLRINGTLSYTKVGGIVFYRYEDVVKLLEKNYNSK